MTSYCDRRTEVDMENNSSGPYRVRIVVEADIEPHPHKMHCFTPTQIKEAVSSSLLGEHNTMGSVVSHAVVTGLSWRTEMSERLRRVKDRLNELWRIHDEGEGMTPSQRREFGRLTEEEDKLEAEEEEHAWPKPKIEQLIASIESKGLRDRLRRSRPPVYDSQEENEAALNRYLGYIEAVKRTEEAWEKLPKLRTVTDQELAIPGYTTRDF